MRVASRVDLFDTYIGGKALCVDHVLAIQGLEDWPSAINARTDFNADTINSPRG